MRQHIPFNDNWTFTDEYKPSMNEASYSSSDDITVRLPHNAADTPYHYFDEAIYQKVCGYRKTFKADPAWKGQHIIASFGAVAHVSEVYINGHKVAEHGCGYTAFEAELTDYISFEDINILVVNCSGTEEDNVPPFGHVVDYMTYTGIYRPVYLDIRPQTYISDVFVRTRISQDFKYDASRPSANKDVTGLHTTVTLNTTAAGMEIKLLLQRCTDVCTDKMPAGIAAAFDAESAAVQRDSYLNRTELGTVEIGSDSRDIKCKTLPVSFWDIEYPALYNLTVQLISGTEVVDETVVRFGFRSVDFTRDGFYLNGRYVKIRGLNRHQSYPYVGYAMPRSMQIMDADILRNELSLNAVRTSHYPQSHDFIGRCDELGLLVFMEFPGWQHIGDAAWKEQALVNLREMITEFRNHSSIMLWGVRINESQDDDEFYTRTNALAHELDDSRQTGGVRAKDHSSLLEDVYTYNDFSHNGSNDGCRAKDKITKDTEHGYLVTEYNGHMFPTKSFDPEDRRSEHAIRHANVLDKVASYQNIAGSFGWCMFDYNTHKDFGSGDRICYHGVMDMFRNPKLASAIYESQRDEHPVLEVSSNMDIGEHNECIRGDIWLITNADSVRFYKNDTFIREYRSSESPYRNMPHGPILVDDYVGDQIEKNEPYGKKQADDIKYVMNSAARFGMGAMPKRAMLKAAGLVAIKHMSFDDALQLYNKYIGDWGGKSTVFKFEAIKDGKVVKTVIKAPASALHLEVTVDHTDLIEGDTYDVAAVRIRAVDDNGNIAQFANEPMTLKVSGQAQLIGPELSSLQGGMGGCYVKTTGGAGTAELLIHTNFDDSRISFVINQNSDQKEGRA